MKRSLPVWLIASLMTIGAIAQDKTEASLQAAVGKLDNATTAKEYQQLATEFAAIARQSPTSWLAWYYAAYSNAKTGWLYENDGDKIEPFARLAEEQGKKALALLDTARQKEETSELYCVLSMANRAWVFINPMSYGRKYGPIAGQYVQKAKAANPANPRALYLEGWEKYATPKMWGGDKKKAKELLEHAQQELTARSATGNAPHWGKREVEELLSKLK
ncbi:hypothetical protein [Paraflavitalea sp. CAU 1676]|uniref:hypothetical protein n=1 Tax=Paraflavitalea sp. CAU 1676 TaxID=3032598 RepID=UPI0023D99420|nr:hypothetical protein [Paraflavitalea sp. CAU 1676]MDF2188066.1 hypothetical protein [Paraflavitalea sp. CAU 1676]